MNLHDLIKSLVRQESWDMGLRLYHEGAVLDAQCSPRSIQARVANESYSFERVTLSVRSNRLNCRCSCRPVIPYCQHVVAVMLYAAQETPDILDVLFTQSQAASATQDRPEAPLPPPSISSLTMDALRDYLRPPIREAQLQLIAPSPLPELTTPSQTIALTAKIVFQGSDFAQGNIRRLIESGHAAADMRLADFDPQAQQVMQFLHQYADFGSRHIILSSAVAADLFHCLRGSSILSSAEGIIQIHLSPLQIQFNVTPQDQAATVIPRIIVPNRGALSQEKLSFIAGKAGFWVGKELEFWWFPGILPFNWLRLFLQGQPLTLSDDELARLTELCESRRFPGKVVLSRAAGKIDFETGRVRPVLTLDWGADGLLGDLQFDYGGKRVEVEGELTIWAGGRFVKRNTAKENDAQNLLLDVGFARTEDTWRRLRLEDKQAIWAFIQEISPKLTPEWIIFWTPQVRVNMAASTEARLALSAGGEGNAWFETTCDLKAADGTPIPFERAVKAISNGEEHVRLASGAIVKLPPDVLNVLNVLASRAQARSDNRYQFSRCHAVAMVETIAPYWSGPRPSWHSLRDRLLHPETEPERPLPDGLGRIIRDYQREGIRWLVVLETCGFHGILADEMGLGKTLQALAVIASRKANRLTSKPSIIICPTSLLENWRQEANRFTPSLRVAVISGSGRTHDFATIPEFDLAVTSYALLRRDSVDYEDIHFDYVVLDEAQHIKNPRTANAQACKELKADHRLVLTGTPIENSLSEIWSLFDFLQPGYLGPQREFRQTYENKRDQARRPQLTAQLASLIRPFILRRTKAEVCAELPPKLEQTLYCELGDEQRRLYDAILLASRHLLEKARSCGWHEHRMEILAMLLRLRQICCHPGLLPPELRPDYPDPMPSVKLDLAREVILQAIDSGHRLLLFSQFTSVLDLFPDWLKKTRIPFERIDGSTGDRQRRVDKFNGDASIPVLLLSLKAGGVGLNLTGADTVIHYDQWWNPMIEDQATDRTHRIGQTRTVTAIKLVVKNTIEEKILRLQDAKRDLFNTLLADSPASLGDITLEDVEFLLSVNA